MNHMHFANFQKLEAEGYCMVFPINCLNKVPHCGVLTSCIFKGTHAYNIVLNDWLVVTCGTGVVVATWLLLCSGVRDCILVY